MIIFKNFFSFALTFKAVEWIDQNLSKGARVFTPIATIQVVVCLLSIPMCEYRHVLLGNGQL